MLLYYLREYFFQPHGNATQTNRSHFVQLSILASRYTWRALKVRRAIRRPIQIVAQGRYSCGLFQMLSQSNKDIAGTAVELYNIVSQFL